MTEILKQLPHRRMEAWKWTDVQRAITNEISGLSSVIVPKFEFPEIVKLEELTPNDVVALDKISVVSGNSPFEKIATEFTHTCWHLGIEAGQKVTDPMLISELGTGHVLNSLWMGENSSFTIIEHHRGSKNSFSNVNFKALLKKGAHLTRIIIHDDPDDAVRIATSEIFADENARFDQYILSFGGKLSRLQTLLVGKGNGVSANMNGAYLLSGQKHTDMTSHTHLSHPNCHIRQSVKGVVTDKAKGVFQGKFHVERAAQHTDAEMRHDALMLSDRAEIRAKPELEIYADDVACAHGNTIGALDDSALFYMRQRGIPMAQAKALLTEAFLASVFDDLADEDMKASLMDQISKWLETSYGV